MTGAKLPRVLAVAAVLGALMSATALALDPPRDTSVPVAPQAPRRPLATTPEPARPAPGQPGPVAAPATPQTPQRPVATTPERARPAGAQPAPPPSAATAALAAHAATGLVFPPYIATARLARYADNTQATGYRGFGHAWTYENPSQLSARIMVYDLDKRVPDGWHDPTVLREFEESMGSIERSWTKAGTAKDIAVSRPPGNCAVGGIVFRCATLSMLHLRTGTRLNTQTLVTGYRQHFLNIQATWREGSVAGQAEVDRFVQIVVGAILR